MKAVLWAMATLVAVGALVVWLGPQKLDERRRELFTESLAAAERARASGDLYRAIDAYTHAEQMASSIDDWRGLLAVACGLGKIGGQEMPSLQRFNVVVKALASAERRKSAEGMNAVADAFASLGFAYASFALSRIRDDWQSAESDRPEVVKRRTFAAGAQPSGC